MYEKNDIEVKGMVKSSFLDWDGKVVTTLYLPKCNFKCPFCHNWELIEHPEDFQTVHPPQIDRHLRTNSDFLDGVCITGGEPTIYENLSQLLEHLSELGFKIKLDTNGAYPDALSDLIDNNIVDYIAMDIKAPLDHRYNKLTGSKIELENIKKSVKIIMDSTLDYEFRTTVIPTLLNGSDIHDIAEEIAGAKKFVLQQYVPDHARDEKLRSIKPYSKSEMEDFRTMARKRIDNVILRGVK
jgi:pyruvate formate lyase activating enzyme